jgi:hypothetical protein
VSRLKARTQESAHGMRTVPVVRQESASTSRSGVRPERLAGPGRQNRDRDDGPSASGMATTSTPSFARIRSTPRSVARAERERLATCEVHRAVHGFRSPTRPVTSSKPN